MNVARSLQTGTVWINRYYNLKYKLPFGGYKHSGIGIESCHKMMDNYTRLETVVVNLNERPGGLFCLRRRGCTEFACDYSKHCASQPNRPGWRATTA